MPSEIKQRILIQEPSEPVLFGPLQMFLIPRVIEGLQQHGNLTYEESKNSVTVYTTPFDPRFIFSKSRHIGCLWTGYSSSMEKYLVAQDEAAAFWLVPSVNAYYSLLYFMGKSGLDWSPRAMVIPDLLPDVREVPKLSEEYKEFAVESKINESITIALWADFDGEDNYISKVMTFIRLFQEAHKLRESESEVDISFLLYHTVGLINLEDWGVSNNGIPVFVTDEFNVISYYADYYFSLSTCATVYDPMCESLHEASHTMCKVYSPIRMDTVNLLNIREMDRMLSRMIASLGSQGSSGIGSMMNSMKPIHEEFLITIVEDLLNSGMQHLVKAPQD